MQIHRVGYRIKGLYRVAALGILWGMTTQNAQQRLKILAFLNNHGIAATCDAFEISARTLHRWRKTLRDAGGSPAALVPRSRAPLNRRQPNWSPALVAQIKALRIEFPNLGKQRLHVLLTERGLKPPSVSTIARIIKADPNKMRHAPTRLTPKGKTKPLRKRRPRQPQGSRQPPLALFACDTVVRMRDGLRRYLLTFIDPRSRFAFAFATSTPSSRQATFAFDALCQLLPQPPRFILSDNGSEFLGHFQARLEQRGIQHWWTFPRSPKMNAHAERFNRTVQEAFVDYHEDLLFDDLAQFNRKLAHWLLQYNTVLPHHSLGLKTPVQFLIHHKPQCHMYWTNTGY